MAKIWVLQHHPAENLGLIAEALESAALAWQYVRVFDGQQAPADMKGAGGLIVMGGPEAVYELDRYPYLRAEMALIENALKLGKPVLGVCLGSQLLAAVLGASVRRGARKEIGWYPVRLRPEAADDRLFQGLPSEFVPCHWHGDVFDLPVGAVALASSELTRHQAFRYGDKAWGLLFHAEMTQQIIAALVHENAEGLKRVGIDGDAILAQAPEHLPRLGEIAETIFGRWAAPIQGT
ncbi:MAG TPA: gamma-glutamyl-gamma-aminobutyrate hydrolase family protein [Candidatus Binataceae bacterium]|jgi:GMP synthase (glutamine-hydrolysing)|nr:gamma-glutamyl-gamma-aminobutyrate hydrolase family protein [Candidatus Binataceae bacterium]